MWIEIGQSEMRWMIGIVGKLNCWMSDEKVKYCNLCVRFAMFPVFLAIFKFCTRLFYLKITCLITFCVLSSWSLCAPRFEIQDAEKNPVLFIQGPICTNRTCCVDINFKVRSQIFMQSISSYIWFIISNLG